MLVQAIELEAVCMIEVSDDALEALVIGKFTDGTFGGGLCESESTTPDSGC